MNCTEKPDSDLGAALELLEVGSRKDEGCVRAPCLAVPEYPRISLTAGVYIVVDEVLRGA